MENQPELLEEYVAHAVAQSLSSQIEDADDPEAAFTTFYYRMQADGDFDRHDSYLFLEIIGLGRLSNCYVWWMRDDSVLIVGWKSEDELAVGVLPPGTTFTPVPYDANGIATVH